MKAKQRGKKFFMGWWKQVAESMQSRGLDMFSFCPEFGPVMYQQADRETGEPLGDLKAICDWQKAEVEKMVAGL